MKKNILWIVVGVVVLLIIGICWSSYNGLVATQQEVDAKWADVETQYQRRSDLIPNLVNTVKGYAKHEQQTLEDVVKARSEATSISLNAANMTKDELNAYVSAQNNVTSALGRLIAIAENYPDLKANQNFLELQAQLEGTENRISVARKEFNEAVKRYNVKVISFPSNLIAGMFGFTQKEFFSAMPAAAEVPTVAF